MTRRLLAVLLALPVLAGCGSDEPYPIDRPGPQQLPSGDYVATDLPAPFGEGDRLRIRFDDGQVSFQATCNSMFGAAALEEDVLVISQVGGTEMGCPGAGHEQDEWLVGFFTSRPTVATLDGGFSLRGEQAEVRLVPPEAAPGEDDVPLNGVVWQLTGIEQTDGDSVGMRVVPRQIGARLEIMGSELRFETGCNSGGGGVTVLGDRLQLRGVSITLKGCNGLRGELESAQLPILMAGAVSWSVSGRELRLTRGATTLLYRATP